MALRWSRTRYAPGCRDVRQGRQASRTRKVPEHQRLEDRGRGRRGEVRVHCRLQVTSGEIVTAPIKREDESDDGFEETRGEADPGIGGRICFPFTGSGGRHCRRAGHVPRAVLRGTETGRDGIPTGQRARSLGGRAHRRWASPAGGSRQESAAPRDRDGDGTAGWSATDLREVPGRDAEIFQVGRDGPRFRGQLLPGRIALGQDAR